jgi:phosphatidylserine decarboxylase
MMLNLLLQYLLPHYILSRLVAKMANCRVRLVKNFFITQYCRFYNIDMTEALEPNLFNYQTFNDFFGRALKPEARLITGDKKTIVSPSDGKISQFGVVNKDQMINAKGKGFTLEQLIANNKDAAQFRSANFAVLYLAPSDYHRIHMPIRGRLISMRYVPGRLFSVNPKIIKHIPDVFAKNERVIITFDTVFGAMMMVLVGAMIVGSVETMWEGVVMPNKQNSIVDWNYGGQEIVFERGMEIGRFKLGSTVILLFPEKTMQWNKTLQQNAVIKMGQGLGVIS